jgi:ABC-type microcin C transport system permease subunit YejB
MSRKELVFIVSRTFALLLISWALVEVSYLPERVFALTHHISQSSVLARYDYWSSYYLVVTSFLVARVLALLFAAGSFWRCGPRVQALFSPQQDNREASA